MTALPSPRTKPLRSLSKGMEALVRSSLFVRAFMLAKPPNVNSTLVDSVPPARQASRYPSFIFLNASPMEFVPEAQAVVTSKFAPLKPVFIEIVPAAILLIIMGI